MAENTLFGAEKMFKKIKKLTNKVRFFNIFLNFF